MTANAKPLILYDSRFLDGTPTATDTATGYDVLNIIDWRLYTYWLANAAGTKYLTVDCGSAKSADTLAIAGHNLYTASATVSVESSTDNANWTERLAGFVPTSDKALLKTFTSASARYWRVKIVTGAVAAKIAVVLLGVRMDFERYAFGNFDPAPEKIYAETVRGKTGHILGSTVSFIAHPISVQWQNLSDTWVVNTFNAAWDAHLSTLKPFFWAWEITNHATEVYYVKIPDDFQLARPYNPYARSLGLTFEGVKES